MSESDVFGPIYNDHIRTLSLTSDYRLQDNFGGTNYFTMTWRQGLDIMGASHKDDDFLVARRRLGKILGAEFLVHALPDPHRRMVGEDCAARPDRLGPAVHCRSNSISAALPSAAAMARPRSAATTAWPARSNCASTRRLSFEYLTGYQLYGFVDGGVAWNDGYRYTDGLSLTSAGAGVRFFFGPDLQADIGVAAPLGYRAPDNTARDVRVLFSLSNAFKLCPDRAATRCL